MRDPDGRALLESLDVEDLCACVLFGEGRGEPSIGRQAIANTAVNRARALLGKGRARDFRQALKAVLLRRWQYSAIEPTAGPDHDGDGLADNYEVVLDVARTLDNRRRFAAGEQMLGEPPEIGPILRDCLRLAHEAAANTLDDVTGHATHYCTVALLESPTPPAWTVGLRPVVILGAHAFFNHVP